MFLISHRYQEHICRPLSSSINSSQIVQLFMFRIIYTVNFHWLAYFSQAHYILLSAPNLCKWITKSRPANIHWFVTFVSKFAQWPFEKFLGVITFRVNNVPNQRANISSVKMILILDYNINIHVHGRVQVHLMEALTSEEKWTVLNTED